MPRNDEPFNLDAKLRYPFTTWVTKPDADRLERAAKGLGWTHSQLLRWAFRETITRAEERVASLERAPRNGNGRRQ